ncbi:MAG: S-layer homology domain-containing protein [Acidimicrobiia bacterium]|nr:S-layer homology domain-containing protein [Acidimicrobiia bacterium]MYD04413.1 S-layer homology domain-containing protein [Acidimicrobiia bacterium]
MYYTQAVATLSALSVFAGTECPEGFCPHTPIDRKTMAVWIVRVLDGRNPPPLFESRFIDVSPLNFYAPYIERLAELGVTLGCGDGSGFCPNRTVSRAQMATFLTRAYKLAMGPDPGFEDVPPGAWYADSVARLAASGITTGCGDGSRFCPHRDVTRAQMATFLYRAEQGPG